MLDTEWIPEVAKRGWLIVTRDNNIIENRNEITAVRESGAKMVALNQRDQAASGVAKRSAFPSLDPPTLARIRRLTGRRGPTRMSHRVWCQRPESRTLPKRRNLRPVTTIEPGGYLHLLPGLPRVEPFRAASTREAIGL